MQARIPVNFRQSFKWIANLDAVSVGLAGGGAVIAFHTIIGTSMPLWQKIMVAFFSTGLGAVLGLGRWPLEYGDGAPVWAQRVFAYRGRSHVYKGVKTVSVSQASKEFLGDS